MPYDSSTRFIQGSVPFDLSLAQRYARLCPQATRFTNRKANDETASHDPAACHTDRMRICPPGRRNVPHQSRLHWRQHHLWLRDPRPRHQQLPGPAQTTPGRKLGRPELWPQWPHPTEQGRRPYTESGRFNQALSFQPDVVIIKLGTNDTKAKNLHHKRHFIPDYISLINRFRALESKPVVWICKAVPVFPERWGISDKTLREEINPRIEYIARKAAVPLIDLYTPLQKPSGTLPRQSPPQ